LEEDKIVIGELKFGGSFFEQHPVSRRKPGMSASGGGVGADLLKNHSLSLAVDQKEIQIGPSVSKAKGKGTLEVLDGNIATLALKIGERAMSGAFLIQVPALQRLIKN